MKIKTHSFVVLSLAAFCFVSTVQAVDYGTAYLIKVNNNTRFDASLKFPEEPEKIIRNGSSVGEGMKEASGGSSSFDNVVKQIGSSGMIPIVTGRNVIKDKEHGDLKNSRISRQPVIAGVGSSELTGFSANHALVIERMLQRGAVWLRDSMSLPGSVSFQAYVEDKGEVVLFFSEEEGGSDQPLLKIVIGQDDNAQSSIYYQDQVVAQADHYSFPFACLAPGSLQKYWVSFGVDNSILVGQGEVGENIFLSYHGQSIEQQIKSIGFSSNTHTVAYSEILFGPQVEQKPIKKYLWSGNEGETEFVLRSQGQGLLIFKNLELETKGYFEIFDKDNSKTLLEVTGQELSLEISAKETEEKLFPELTKKVLFQTVPDVIWINFNQNFATVGVGDPFKGEAKIIKKIYDSRFSGFLRVQVGSENLPVKLADPIVFRQASGIGREGEFRLPSSLNLLRPYEYEFSQKGPAIIGTDKIRNQSFILGKAPQDGAIYSFMLTIGKNTRPEIKWLVDPINPKKWGLKAAVTVLRIGEGIAFSQADEIPEENVQDPVSQIGLTLSNLGAALTGAGLRMSAGALEAKVEHDFVHAKDTYVLEEKAVVSEISKNIPAYAKKQKKIVDTTLAEISMENVDSRKSFDKVFSGLQDVFQLMNHPYVISSVSSRDTLERSLEKIFLSRNVIKNLSFELSVFKQKRELAQNQVLYQLIGLMSQALKNYYFLTDKTDLERAKKSKFDHYFHQLSAEYLSQTKKPIRLVDQGGQVLWSNSVLLAGNGSVLFQAKGVGDLSVFLTTQKKQPFRGELCYQVLFDDTHLRIAPLFSYGMSAQLDATKNSDFVLSGITKKPFWINMKDGNLSAGQGVLGDNQLLSWQDPYFEKENLIVGFSTGSSGIEISNLGVGPEKEEVPEAMRQLASQGAKIVATLVEIEQDKNNPTWIEKLVAGKGLILFSGNKKDKIPKAVLAMDKAGFDQLTKYAAISYDIDVEKQILKINFQDSGKTKKTIDLELGQEDEFQIWLNVDKGIVATGLGDWWDENNQALWQLPLNKKADVYFGWSSPEQKTQLEQAVFSISKNSFQPEFLQALSLGKIQIKKSRQEKEAEDSLNVNVEALRAEQKEEDRMFLALERETRVRDVLEEVEMEEQYDILEVSDVEMEQMFEEKAPETVSQEEKEEPKAVLNKTFERKKEAAHLERGSMQKAQEQGLGGAIAALKGEGSDLLDAGKLVFGGIETKKKVLNKTLTPFAKELQGFNNLRKIRNVGISEDSQGIGDEGEPVKEVVSGNSQDIHDAKKREGEVGSEDSHDIHDVKKTEIKTAEKGDLSGIALGISKLKEKIKRSLASKKSGKRDRGSQSQPKKSLKEKAKSLKAEFKAAEGAGGKLKLVGKKISSSAKAVGSSVARGAESVKEKAKSSLARRREKRAKVAEGSEAVNKETLREKIKRHYEKSGEVQEGKGALGMDKKDLGTTGLKAKGVEIEKSLKKAVIAGRKAAIVGVLTTPASGNEGLGAVVAPDVSKVGSMHEMSPEEEFSELEGLSLDDMYKEMAGEV